MERSAKAKKSKKKHKHKHKEHKAKRSSRNESSDDEFVEVTRETLAAEELVQPKKPKQQAAKPVDAGPSSDKPSDAEIQALREKLGAGSGRRKMQVMTKEEYDKVGAFACRYMTNALTNVVSQQQKTVREVYDPDTGRVRLVRGTGEIIEQIVSRERHQELNKVSSLSLSIYRSYSSLFLTCCLVVSKRLKVTATAFSEDWG